jgi:hypothetical protein
VHASICGSALASASAWASQVQLMAALGGALAVLHSQSAHQRAPREVIALLRGPARVACARCAEFVGTASAHMQTNSRSLHNRPLFSRKDRIVKHLQSLAKGSLILPIFFDFTVFFSSLCGGIGARTGKVKN